MLSLPNTGCGALILRNLLPIMPLARHSSSSSILLFQSCPRLKTITILSSGDLECYRDIDIIHIIIHFLNGGWPLRSIAMKSRETCVSVKRVDILTTHQGQVPSALLCSELCDILRINFNTRSGVSTEQERTYAYTLEHDLFHHSSM